MKVFTSNENGISVLLVLKAWSRRALLPPAALHTEDATLWAGNPDLTSQHARCWHVLVRRFPSGVLL